MNPLPDAGLMVQDALFAPLDPTVRRAETADGRVYTLTDTVGFVRNLPHELIEAFRSTLEEVAGADLVLHIVDAAHPDPVGQVAAVRAVLADIPGALDVPELIVLNKIDLTDAVTRAALRTRLPGAIEISARTGEGIEDLRARTAGSADTGGDATSEAPTRWVWEPWFAAVLLVLVGWRTEITGGIFISDCVALASLPITWSAVRTSRRFALLLILALLATAAGWALSLAAYEDFTIIAANQRTQLLLAASLPASVAAFVWGRKRLGLEGAVIAFGTGAILGNLHLLQTSDNPWKLDLGAAVSVVVLAMSQRFGRGGQLVAALALGGIYLVHDSRGATGMFVLIITLLVWQIISSSLSTTVLSPGRLRVRHILLLPGLAGVAILGVVAAAIAGYLGPDVQERTTTQLHGSNLLIAARPELGASWALLTHRPWGYGAGLQPRYEDVRTAMQGMASVNYNPNNGYVHNYMFGHGFELHSGLADIWIALSLPGAALLLFVVWLGLRALWENLGTAHLRSWLLFAVLLMVMNAAIGPLLVLPPYLTIAAGTALCLQQSPDQPPGQSPPSPRRDRS